MSGPLAQSASSGRPLRFQAGGTLGEDALYVERPADDELPAALARGELCYVLATRQMGKSSLRVRAMKRLGAQGIACACVDLTAIGTDDIAAPDWYYGLTREIADQLELGAPDAFWDAHPELGPVHCFSRWLEDEVAAGAKGRVVIFIDEIDATLSLPFSRDDFFAAVRAFYNRRAERTHNQQVTFCLLGVAAPGDLIADPTRTPFNIGRAIRLEDFTRQEMDGFASGLATLPPARQVRARHPRLRRGQAPPLTFRPRAAATSLPGTSRARTRRRMPCAASTTSSPCCSGAGATRDARG